MSRSNRIILSVLVGLALVLAGYCAGCRARQESSPTIVIDEITDTLYLRDTISVPTPVYVARTTVDTMLVPVTDTLVLRDTLWMSLPRESVHYGDSLFDAWVSGYRPALDSLRLYPTTQIVTRMEVVKTKPRWSAGVQVGVGASREGLSPYVGIGVQYNLLWW